MVTMMIRVTGSALDRVARCEASAALPQATDANDEDDEAKDRRKGSVRHKYLERVIAVGHEEALAEVDAKHRGMCADIDLAKLGDRLKLSAEVAMAYNYRDDTARILIPVAPRVYDIDSRCEIAGTFDLVGVSADACYLGDYKGAHGWLPAPSASRQLGLGALCLARIYNKETAHVEYIRLLDDGNSIPWRAEMDGFALDAVGDEIRAVMALVPPLRARILAGEVPNVVEGGWCRYCSARFNCPPKTAMVRAVISDPPVPYSTGITPENAREAYLMLRKAKDAVKIFEAGLYAYAKLERIPIETQTDGSVLYFGELSRPGDDVLDGAIGHRVLAARYGGEAANKAVTMKITKAAIKDVIRPNLKPDEKITKVFDAVIDEIDAAGGIKNPTTVTCVEHSVSPEGDAKARKRKAAP
jgi:hypothetical protein